MRRIRKRVATAMVMAMVPLSLVPAVLDCACICADGTFKLYCGHCACGDAHRDGCSCCDRPADAETGPGCSKCHGHDRAPSARDSIPGHSDRCCTPVLDAPVAVAKAVELPAKVDLAVTLAPEAVPPAGWLGDEKGCATNEVGVFPPPDLVILHHVLLI